MAKTPSEVRIRAQQCGHELNSEEEFHPQRARGKEPYLSQVYTAACLDGTKKVTIRFASGVTDKNSLVWVSCTCPYFLFYVEYALARVGSSSIIYCNGEPPYIRNPSRTPYLCKHLYSVASRIQPGKKRKASVEMSDIDQQALEDAVHLALLLLSRAPVERRAMELDLADAAPLHVIGRVLDLLGLHGFIKERGTVLEATTKGLEYLVTLG